MNRVTKFTALVAVLILVSTSAFAQTTASLKGTVTSDGAGLPGVTVTISSPQMQGTRTTTTGDAGGYSFGSIPPGDYTVRFELEGLATVSKRVQIGVGQSGSADADLKVAAVAEAITVTAAAPSVLETPTVTTNINAKTVEELPIGRTVMAVAQLAPGVNGNTFSNNQLSISGSPGYDNLVMVNGVSITEAVRSQSLNLFIEDAIQETTVMTGAISAEYGRFTGGVVNSITKSGGNEFSGSLRDSFTNDAWTEENPRQVLNNIENIDKLNQVWEATLGGFILRDRLWFFGAGRDTETSNDVATRAVPGSTLSLSAVRGDQERRLEGKLTGQITAKHNLSASYFDSQRTQTNTQFTTLSYDLESLTDREDPQSLLSAFYNGVLSNNLMLEARYSEMEWGVGRGSGSQFTDVIRGTIVRNRADQNARWNSPTFCGVCDDETRANDNIGLKLNYFLSNRGIGNHSLVAGIDRYAEHRFANNYQSGSNYRFFVNSVQRIGDQLYPTLTPGPGGSATYFVWTPIFILQNNESDLATDSAFINDRWDLNEHWSFSAGVRYDKNDATDSSGNKVSDDSRFSPRLNATYDVLGNGRHRVSASYGEYASRIVEGPGTNAASGGSPGYVYYAYQGPAINQPGTPESELLNTREALQVAFDWLLSQCNAQGQCGPENISLLRANSPHSVPGYDYRLDGALKSPYVQEITLGYGLQISNNAVARFDLVSRDWRDFYAYRVDQASYQQLTDPLGIPHDVANIENTNDIERTYRALQFQTNWRPGRFNLGLNYTLSELKGNDEQENATSGTVGNSPSSIYYPELTNYARYQPTGYLTEDSRHRARAWVGYDVPLPRVVGLLNVSVLQSFDSGRPYSAFANNTAGSAIDLTPYLDELLGAAPYETYSATQNYYFSDRGEYRLDDISATDLALNYRLPLGRAEFFAQGDVLNVFDRQTATIVNVAMRTAGNNSNFTPFNPFTTAFEDLIECPQGTAVATCKAMGAHWQKGPDFGKPTSSTGSTPANAFTSNFQVARTYRLSVGFRF